MVRPWNNDNICNVAGALVEQSQQQPDTCAIHYPINSRRQQTQYQSCSYAELNRLSNRLASGLHAYGINRDTRTALMVPPGLDFFALFFALFKVGAVPVLIDPGIGIKPLKKCLAEAAPEAFIGIGKAHWARFLLGWARDSLNKLVTVGPRNLPQGVSLETIHELGDDSPFLARTTANETAAILFTSGSTGIPKGVVYQHRHFAAQVEMLAQRWSIQPGEVDLPTFPPFALFDPALGMTTVVPDMDPTRPARANPVKLLQAIEQFQVTNIFGSPALLRTLGQYTQQHNIHLPSVKRIISAGAAVPTSVIKTMQAALPETSRIFTPYGATECLPVASIDSLTVLNSSAAKTAQGRGICVGKPFVENQLRIIAIDDAVISDWQYATILEPDQAGEIVVLGPTTTEQYYRRPEQTELAKIPDGNGSIWHRMGDIGYLDEDGQLWYLGRKSQRVETPSGTLFADQIEAIFNEHPQVTRCALVGIGQRPVQTAVLCIENQPGLSKRQQNAVLKSLQKLATENPLTVTIRHFLFHPKFPVDIRHNAKIGREKLACWAAKKLPEKKLPGEKLSGNPTDKRPGE